MTTTLGSLQTQFFAYIQMRRLQTVRTGELVRALGLSDQQERELLSRLARRGLIARVCRGLYLVPPRLPPGGKWTPGEFLALATLIEEHGGRYQICGPSAFHRYGWDDQVPNRLYVYNNRISGERKIGTVSMTLIKLADERLGEVETAKTPDGIDAIYSSRARSLVDAIYDWSRFDSLPRGYSWIRSEVSRNEGLAAEIIRVALRYGNTTTLRRLGRLLELGGVAESLLRKLARELARTTSPIPWTPARPKQGRVDRRWGVIVNDGS
jgi:predicted transcriptional regulator of viral defense system